MYVIQPKLVEVFDMYLCSIVLIYTITLFKITRSVYSDVDPLSHLLDISAQKKGLFYSSVTLESLLLGMKWFEVRDSSLD